MEAGKLEAKREQIPWQLLGLGGFCLLLPKCCCSFTGALSCFFKRLLQSETARDVPVRTKVKPHRLFLSLCLCHSGGSAHPWPGQGCWAHQEQPQRGWCLFLLRELPKKVSERAENHSSAWVPCALSSCRVSCCLLSPGLCKITGTLRRR